MSTAAPETAATRQRILEAACDRIASHGIDDVRIARIAQDAGVSTALVHYHFETREALLFEALQHSFAIAGEHRIVHLREAADGPHAARLAQMVEDCLPLPGGKQEREWVLWVELWLRTVRHPELRPLAAKLYASLQRWFAAAIADGVEAGEFRPCDARAVADRTIALIDGLGVRALLGDPAMTVARARAEIGAALARDVGVDELLAADLNAIFSHAGEEAR